MIRTLWAVGGGVRPVRHASRGATGDVQDVDEPVLWAT